MFNLLGKKKIIVDSEEESKEISELKRQLSILKGIQDAMPDPYYVRDMEYNIILWPKAIQELTGYSEEEARRLKCSNIFKADVCRDCPTQKCVQAGQFLKDALVDIYRKNGERVIALVSNAGVYDEDGKAIGAVEIVKDNTNYHSLMESISLNAEQLSAVSEELAASSQEVSALSSELNGQSTHVSGFAKEGLLASIDVQKKADNCSEFAREVRSNVDKISKSMGQSVKEIEVLQEKSEVIIDIVTTIQGIASQTNLLALNASIEAARAGEAGRGFSVVAEEIRKLAESSNSSASEIKNTIDEIIKLVENTIELMDSTGKSVSSGEQQINELLNLIGDIKESSHRLVKVIKGIEESAQQTAQISDNQNASIGEVAKGGQELAGIAQTLQQEIERMRHANM